MSAQTSLFSISHRKLNEMHLGGSSALIPGDCVIESGVQYCDVCMLSIFLGTYNRMNSVTFGFVTAEGVKITFC